MQTYVEMCLTQRLWSLEMESVTRVQFLGEVFYVSLRTNGLEKGMNPSFLFPVLSK